MQDELGAGDPFRRTVEDWEIRSFLAKATISTIGVIAIGAGMALAADLEITPSEPEVGRAKLTIDVLDFAPDTPIYAVPCETLAKRVAVDITADECDISQVESSTTESDGNATIVVNWGIPADGAMV